MKIAIILVAVLAAMQGVGWWAYKASQKNGTDAAVEKAPPIAAETTIGKDPSDDGSEIVDLDLPENRERYKDLLADGGITYPLVQIEEVDGTVERTIHMGVRQWAWDPFELEAKQGEKIRLVIHNDADITHSISIPGLGVKADIPGEGAVIEFVADKKGAFEYSCDTSCGEGHGEMRGKLVIS